MDDEPRDTPTDRAIEVDHQPTATSAPQESVAEVVAEELIEEISIDGMCGVY